MDATTLAAELDAAHARIAALDAAHARIAALEKVAEAAKGLLNADDPYGEVCEGVTQMDVLLAAVTALDTATLWVGLTRS